MATVLKSISGSRTPLDLGVEEDAGGELERFHRHQYALFALARGAREAGASLEARLDPIVETAARTLRVERVSIWLFSDDRSRIEARSFYSLASGTFTRGTVLMAADYPAYFRALEENRIIAAHHAPTDTRTSEFADSYLTPNSISSMLDSPILQDGKVIGVVCHEHVGPARKWRIDEQVLAASFADVATLTIADWQREQSENERREIERKMYETQRLESVGFLASKIAHDFNNLLVPISGWADLLQRIAHDESAVKDAAGSIQGASRRAGELIRELLNYTRQESPAFVKLDPAEVLEDMRGLLRMLVPPIIAMEFVRSGEPLSIEASAIQIQQVILNLVANASHAIGEKPGSISAGWRRMDDAAPLLAEVPGERRAELQGRPVAVIEVRDSGCGMDEATRRKVFEPFFTTKGYGHGLGLAAVAGIVDAHKGAITCESTPGKGTTFRICIPIA